jgi:hypothetical protein
MSRSNLLLTCLVVGTVEIGLIHRLASVGSSRASASLLRRISYALQGNTETQMRERFLAEHPHEKPLNWAMGQVAVQFHKSQPMGRFVLHKNDCSDFVECVIDESLGVKARFKRGSDVHLIGLRSDVFDSWYWTPGEAVMPGDVLSVEHSPWYAPYEGAIWHVGIVGADGMVYDFTKLRRWREAKYGRHTFDWFVRHSNYEGGIIIGRLKAEYRYRVKGKEGEGGGRRGK